ncbi:MAG TPA: DUF2254 family protein [Polyangia bacterium]|jgi:hypothetical protein|nr:DUF2254 family protein [Polyangia bacterium]
MSAASPVEPVADPAAKPSGLLRHPLRTLALLAAFAVTLFLSFWLLDYFYTDVARHGSRGPVQLFFDFDPGTLQNALPNLAQIITAVLGIAITVVSIVVQLAANRYTPRVAEMFFRDRISLTVMGFFVVACVDSLWVSFAVTHDYVPQATIAATIAVATCGLLLLVPYFAYVFDFLDPEKVIARIGDQTLRAALEARDRGGARSTIARQAATVTSMEQLGDIAVNALAQKDKVIASDAISALRAVAVSYLPQKTMLPPDWFVIGPTLLRTPDFVALAAQSIADMQQQRTWLEWKVLRQFREVFAQACQSLPEMAHVVAIEARYVGEAALACGDQAVLQMTIKFMNTFLRQALNGRDVRAAYNVLNQYRQLAEAVMNHDTADATATLIDVAGHFRYYAQLGSGMGLSFVAETAAYDLCTLCERASDRGAPAHDRLLATLLELDKEAENTAQEKALRGVRKAQAKLASYYLLHGKTAPARTIHTDMAMETPERLRSIRDELLAVTSKEFWEVVDRGTNFDYLDDARKEALRAFFDWFGDLGDIGDIGSTARNP